MKNKRVLLFLAQGFEAYEASVFTDVMGWSRSFGNAAVDLITLKRNFCIDLNKK